MNGTVLSARTCQVAVVGGEGLVSGQRVGVNPLVARRASAGLLLPFGEESQARPVRLVAVPEVPERGIAISEALARETGVADDGEEWELRLREPTPAASIVLEPKVDIVVDDAVRQLRASTSLDGRLFFAAPAKGTGAAWLDLQGVPYRVRDVSDARGNPLRGLVKIDTTTQVELFVSGARAGVDIVILADCSASMSWSDVPTPGETLRGSAARHAYMTRMDALKRALRQMAESRMQVGGRVARLAMVRFTTRSTTVFPVGGGMEELGTTDDDESLRKFKVAVGKLRPEDASTDIGQAIGYAGDLLDTYGLPYNDRLIVLVSDGADWNEKGVEKTGEVLAVRADAVSLTQELHETQNVRLHALGISDEEQFFKWWRQSPERNYEPAASLIPNHRLLRRIVEEGGGDASRIGGVDVLEEYFSMLGAGVTRSIGRPRPEVLPPAQRGIAALFPERRRLVVTKEETRLKEVAERIQQLYGACVLASANRTGQSIYRSTSDPMALLTIGNAVSSRDTFNAWVLRMDQIFHERLDSRLRKREPDEDYDVPGMHEIIWDGKLENIHMLRISVAHDTPGRNNKNQAAEHRKKIGDLLVSVTGRYHLMDDDAAGWGRLQLHLMEELSDMLTKLESTINSAPKKAQDGIKILGFN
ncbi:vWA domain-containing protein [Sinosporangium siamense]|uniref:VWFA domain-containing protein n=1 Tax=Sinosporangium siamense TaxID=1367973 RepID=A0A919RE71_9ACTN|nr:vWA domain-containing protein [Sinosporangium siamense]GII90251.1 hypothetical protein Ssi02_04820 [Sinosporangium siamense]